MTKTKKKVKKPYVPKIKAPALVSTSIQRKEFKYSIGPVTLAFTLRTDVKDKLEPFKQMMEIAIKDIEADIEKIT